MTPVRSTSRLTDTVITVVDGNPGTEMYNQSESHFSYFVGTGVEPRRLPLKHRNIKLVRMINDVCVDQAHY